MRIALLTDGLFPDVIGGMQKHSFFLARYLARQKVYVDLYYTAPNINDRRAFEQFTAQEKEYVSEHFIPFPSRGFLPGHYLKESFEFSTRIHRKWSQQPKVDLIYAQGFTGWYFADRHSRGLLETPLAVNLHGLEMFQVAFGLKARLQQYLLRGPARFIINNADLVYSLGGKLTAILREQMKHPDRIAVQPIGIDQEWITSKPIQEGDGSEPHRFIFVGRYEKRKGLDILNRAMHEVPSQQAQFDIVGPIDQSKRVIAENIRYIGLVKEESELQNLLDDCDVLICPSFAEGMPTVILEAMSRGLAVIASDVGAVSELVTSETGWIVEAGDYNALKYAIQDAAEMPLTDKKKAALALIKSRFTWNQTIKDTLIEWQDRFNIQALNNS